MSVIKFITGAQHKIREVEQICSSENFPFKIVAHKLDLDEYQGSTQDITIKKCQLAYSIVKSPLIVEDTCLGYNAMKGLPGPYIKYFLEAIGPEGLYKMLTPWSDKSAFALCTVGYIDGKSDKVHLFEGRVEGEIVPPVYSEKGFGFGFDHVFKPNGFDTTFSDLGPEIKHKISHRSLAFQKFRDYILSQNQDS